MSEIQVANMDMVSYHKDMQPITLQKLRSLLKKAGLEVNNDIGGFYKIKAWRFNKFTRGRFPVSAVIEFTNKWLSMPHDQNEVDARLENALRANGLRFERWTPTDSRYIVALTEDAVL